MDQLIWPLCEITTVSSGIYKLTNVETLAFLSLFLDLCVQHELISHLASQLMGMGVLYAEFHREGGMETCLSFHYMITRSSCNNKALIKAILFLSILLAKFDSFF